MSAKRTKQSNTPTKRSNSGADQQQNRQLIHHHQEHYQGPIPQPQYLDQYNQIVPGAAERIIKMAEEDARHRREMEQSVLAAEIEADTRKHTEATRGQILGGLAVFASFSVAGLAIVFGMSGVAGTICSVTVIGLVTAFVTGRSKKNDNQKP